MIRSRKKHHPLRRNPFSLSFFSPQSMAFKMRKRGQAKKIPLVVKPQRMGRE
jgi:hypothetical protein